MSEVHVVSATVFCLSESLDLSASFHSEDIYVEST